MYVIGYFLAALSKVIDFVLLLCLWAVVARAILSWVSPDPYNPIVRFVYNVTEPILRPIRNRIPVSYGGIDLSPIVVFLGVVFLRTFVVSSLHRFSLSLM